MSGPAANLNEKLSVGLVHHPVVNKFNEVVTSSVTTMDVHDMARLCKTYGVPNLFIVTPLAAQRRLVMRVVKHWTAGFGGEYNPDRKEALDLVTVVDTIEDMKDNLMFSADGDALVVTSAKDTLSAVSCAEARVFLKTVNRAALLFGTAHGLDESVIRSADIRLRPITGAGEYNHLPVRCAAAIIMDRLLGHDDTE